MTLAENDNEVGFLKGKSPPAKSANHRKGQSQQDWVAMTGHNAMKININSRLRRTGNPYSRSVAG
jgi:hypothetical protein